VGRVKATGALLPGGAPPTAHAHRALPAVTGAPGLMLRRSYSYDAAPGDQGLLFISFQRHLGTFVRTQHTLEAGDALMAYTKTTGTGTFLIVPAWTPDRPLGSALFA
jgi:dye decolorizing peroxidase